jgi:ATP-dependent exoDNAse (exonuclease V) beta subunit
MRRTWDDAEAQVEGRPDAEAESVSIITMHSAKGLEWPIVIPINSPTELHDDDSFLYRRSDDTVHFKLFDQAPANISWSRPPKETSCAASACASGTSR